ncbi:MAG: hypothetical protein HYU87_11375 [Chloroflexi bacterium]|nr:hypothetical protein [Chloroflexota bacterium]
MTASKRAAGETSSKIPWYGWVGLVVFVVVGLVVVYLTHKPIVSAEVRWAVTIAWIVITVALGIYDFMGVAHAPAGSIDVRPVDRWTIPHAGAGLVFGVWFLPFVVVLPLVALWEVFEWLPTGFGQTEIIQNRLVDIGVALVGWFLVTLVASIVTGTQMPWVI